MLKGAHLKQFVIRYYMPFKKIMWHILISDFKIPYTFPLLTSAHTCPHANVLCNHFHHLHFLVLPLGPLFSLVRTSYQVINFRFIYTHWGSPTYVLPNELRDWRLWREINVEDLFKGLRICKLGIQLSKNPKVFQRKKGKLRVPKTAFLALGLVQDSCQSDVRRSGWWVPGCLRMGSRRSGHIWWSGYMSLSGG